MAELIQTSPGWFVQADNPDGPKVRKKAGDTVVSKPTPPDLVIPVQFADESQIDSGSETVHFPPPTEAEREAKLQAYTALKGAGVEVPRELATEVEAWIREEENRRAEEAQSLEQEQAKIEEENETGPWWVRNAYHAPFSLRLDRQEKRKRIELKPRGQRGDLHPLEEGDLNDAILQANLSTGLIEIVPNGEAKNILSKQTQNLQREHVPLSVLRSETGKAYTPDQIKLNFQRQGVVVAYEDPNLGKEHENAKWRTNANAGLVRAQPGQPRPTEVSTCVPTVGNPAIISSGFPADANAQAKIADDLARRRGTVPSLSVSVAPTQRT